MRNVFRTHKKLSVAGLALVVVLVILSLALALIDWNLLKLTIARAISAKTGRETGHPW
jgi:uncharacterized protein involved in outer membrane biogenesis